MSQAEYDFSETLARIAGKIEKAGGALNPPLAAPDTAEFEREFDVVLPADYRAFVTGLGDGGAGPGAGLGHGAGDGAAKGLFPLWGEPPMTLSGPIWHSVAPPIGEEPQAAKALAGQRRPGRGGHGAKRWGPRLRRLLFGERSDIACLLMSDYGGGDVTLLCIDGAHYGAVLHSQGEESRLSHSGFTSFLSWYEHWLDRVLAGDWAIDEPAISNGRFF